MNLDPSFSLPNFPLPFATSTGYVPVTLNSFSGTSASGSISFRAENVNHPNRLDVVTPPTDKGIDKYWTLSATNISNVTGNIVFGYDVSHVNIGAVEANFQGGRWDGDWSLAGSVNDATHEMTVSFTSAADTEVSGEYTPGEVTAFLATFYSINTGNWNDPNNWTFDVAAGTGGTPAGVIPPAGANVIIETGEVITVTGNGEVGVNDLTIDSY